MILNVHVLLCHYITLASKTISSRMKLTATIIIFFIILISKYVTSLQKAALTSVSSSGIAMVVKQVVFECGDNEDTYTEWVLRRLEEDVLLRVERLWCV